jgi:hypothetical protein
MYWMFTSSKCAPALPSPPFAGRYGTAPKSIGTGSCCDLSSVMMSFSDDSPCSK